MLMGIKITAKQRIAAMKEIMGLPSDDDWYYVWVHPISQDYSNTVSPMVDWCKENRTIYWEYKWVYEAAYKKWKYNKNLLALYPDRKVCFRFSNPEDAALFKITWS